MKTTRRRFLAGTIGAVGLFLAGPAIRPAAAKIVEPEPRIEEGARRSSTLDFTPDSISEQVHARWSGRKLDSAFVREVWERLEIPAAIDRDWMTVTVGSAAPSMKIVFDMPLAGTQTIQFSLRWGPHFEAAEYLIGRQRIPSIDGRYDETDADLRSRILSTIREHDGGVSI